jgi:hypothetical protein
MGPESVWGALEKSEISCLRFFGRLAHSLVIVPTDPFRSLQYARQVVYYT